MAWAKRVDGPHAAIVQALKQAGCSVLDTSRLGSGAPDLLVGRSNHVMFLEVKSGKGKLRPAQHLFAMTWQGCPVLVVRTVEDALRLVGVAV